MQLLNGQKNDLAREIEKAGFALTQFAIKETPIETDAAELSLTGTRYFFRIQLYRIQGNPSEFRMHQAPGFSTFEQSSKEHSWTTTSLTYCVMKHFITWLGLLKKELSIPDPWEAVKAASIPDSQPGGDTLNIPFTFPEWEQVKTGIDAIRKFLTESSSNDANAIAVINTRMDQLVEDGKRMGRKDWFNQAVSFLVGVMMMIGASESVQRTVWEMLKSALSGIYHLVPVISEGARHALRQ